MLNEIEKEFRLFIQKNKFELNTLKPMTGINLMIKFFLEFDVDGCNKGIDEGDGLLFQYGVYDWGKGKSFEYNITRQLMITSDDDEEYENGEIFQLSLTFQFPPFPNLEEERDEFWCFSLSEVEKLRNLITGLNFTNFINDLTPNSIDLEFYSAD